MIHLTDTRLSKKVVILKIALQSLDSGYSFQRDISLFQKCMELDVFGPVRLRLLLNFHTENSMLSPQIWYRQ